MRQESRWRAAVLLADGKDVGRIDQRVRRKAALSSVETADIIDDQLVCRAFRTHESARLQEDVVVPEETASPVGLWIAALQLDENRSPRHPGGAQEHQCAHKQTLKHLIPP